MSKSIVLDCVAIVISMAALGLASYQGYETSKANRIAVEPHLDLSLVGAKGISQTHGFRLDNAGNGSAYIKELNLFVDDVKVTGEKDEIWFSALNQVGWPSENITDLSLVYLPEGSVINDGRVIYLLALNNREGQKGELSFDEWSKLRRISIRVDYQGAFMDSCHVLFQPMNSAAYSRTRCNNL